jgi:transcriptional regulator with XRE-family HTH domain
MNKTIHDPVYRRLIAELRRTRQEKGLRQADIAKRMGTERNWLSKIERCELRIDVLYFVRWCIALGLSPCSVLKPLVDSSSR